MTSLFQFRPLITLLAWHRTRAAAQCHVYPWLEPDNLMTFPFSGSQVRCRRPPPAVTLAPVSVGHPLENDLSTDDLLLLWAFIQKSSRTASVRCYGLINPHRPIAQLGIASIEKVQQHPTGPGIALPERTSIMEGIVMACGCGFAITVCFGGENLYASRASICITSGAFKISQNPCQPASWVIAPFPSVFELRPYERPRGPQTIDSRWRSNLREQRRRVSTEVLRIPQ